MAVGIAKGVQSRPARQILRRHPIARDVQSPDLAVGGRLDAERLEGDRDFQGPCPVGNPIGHLPLPVPGRIVLDPDNRLAVEDDALAVADEMEAIVPMRRCQINLHGVVRPHLIVAPAAVRLERNAGEHR